MSLPTDAQKRAWDRFSAASKESAAETIGLSGRERMAARARLMSEALDSDSGN